MRNLILLIIIVFSFGLAQGWTFPERGYMFRFGIVSFLFLVLLFLLFSIIFWGVYLFLVKGKSREEKKE
uniref:Uncharacterized protein n=1 Tax=candidate division WOR-3 bacterium TaxID=2052148 RepID=A0A7C6EC76_UNCW3